MSRNIRNIFISLILAIVLPVTVFTVLEIGNLNENEQLLEDAYREQLQSIIFSVNQYSTDLFDFYIREIDEAWVASKQTFLVDSVFDLQNSSIPVIIAKKNRDFVQYQKGFETSPADLRGLERLFQQHASRITQLVRYKEANYTKPEPLPFIRINGQVLSPILLIIGVDTPCILLVEPVSFVEDILNPWTQQRISPDKFNVTFRDKSSGSLLLGTSPAESQIVERDSLWLLPGVEVGLNLVGKGVNTLIAERTERNLITLGALILLIIAGFVFVLINVRKEMQLSKAKSDFVANVSHEIKTPLALIHMFSETLLMDRVNTEEKKKEYYDIISKETMRLTNILNKILSFSQIDAQKKNYTFTMQDPNTVIASVMKNYSFHLSSKGFRTEIVLDDTRAEIPLDKDAFEEVLINLIDNVIKYSSEEKYLRVQSKLEGNHFKIEVIDHGIGISKADQKHIFDKFYRVTKGDRYTVQGTGLGLALIRDIVEAHNGYIEVESRPGAGTNIQLYFPTKSNSHE